MEILRKLNDTELKTAYDQVFREAFPPAELKPLASMRRLQAEGHYDILGYFRDGEAQAYICCWRREPFVLIDYLCVERAARNGGIGARLLRIAQETYAPGTVFIGEVEAPTGNADADGLILRRLDFYKRCGARNAGYNCALFGVVYRTIYWAEQELPAEEILRNHDIFYRQNFTPELYDRAIQLPLKEGEQPFDRSAWNEKSASEGEIDEL